jgi:hypothetical protein
MIRSIN